MNEEQAKEFDQWFDEFIAEGESKLGKITNPFKAWMKFLAFGIIARNQAMQDELETLRNGINLTIK